MNDGKKDFIKARILYKFYYIISHILHLYGIFCGYFINNKRRDFKLNFGVISSKVGVVYFLQYNVYLRNIGIQKHSGFPNFDRWFL